MGEKQIVRIDGGNFNERSLDGFILAQRVTKCWRKVNGKYELLPANYTEDWNLSRRREMAKKIISAVHNGSIAFAAVKNDTVIGFALLKNGLFGSCKQYLDLAEFYVSKPYRRCGTGRQLFETISLEAKQYGAKKLYISAHSAEESIAAYQKYGCVFAKEPDLAHIQKEPFDLQLEYDLSEHIYEVTDKESFSELLLLADEQQEMVERYINKSKMYAIGDCGVKGEITVMNMGNGILEIKNLAIKPEFQRRGYGKKLIDFICEKYKDDFTVLQVGTGDSPLTLPFYKKCGFEVSHTVKDFFMNNYDHPIIEVGNQLKDMVYLTKSLCNKNKELK